MAEGSGFAERNMEEHLKVEGRLDHDLNRF
jgi:hypothetical protein